MADFFAKEEGKEEEKKEGEEKETAEETKIKIEETEYEPEELQKMVDVSNKVGEFEKKSGTDFDGLTSSWGKRGEEIGKLKKELEEAQEEKTEEKVVAGEELSEEEQIKRAQTEAQRLGLVTENSLDEWYEKKATDREQAKDLLTSCEKLRKKIDGEDGRPAFKTKDILEHMSESGIRNPQDAYDLKFKPELLKWRDDKLSGKKPAGLTTEESSSAGGKEPKQPKVTSDNLSQAVREGLDSGGN